MEKNRHKKILSEIFHATLNSVIPYEPLNFYRERILDIYRSNYCKRLISIAFGKAACHMTKAAENIIGDIISYGIVITKYRHCPQHHEFKAIRVFEAGHPIPDEKGLKGTEEIIRHLREADEHTLIVCLVSGGGSALLV